jgi:nucleoside-diphosphate-sugar epimerase
MVRPASDLWRLEAVLDRVHFVYGDLTDVAAAKVAIRNSAPQIVFHLGWQGVTAAFRNDPTQITANVRGSLDLWEAVNAAGTCRVWVGVGSQAEYGRVAEDMPLSEDLPAIPETNYGLAKHCVALLTERLCALADMRFVWLRLLATYGPRDDERHLIPSVIRQLLAGQRPALTPGEQRWDYLYVDDAIDALWRVATNPDASGTFVLGSGEACMVRSLVERIRDTINPALPLGWAICRIGGPGDVSAGRHIASANRYRLAARYPA